MHVHRLCLWVGCEWKLTNWLSIFFRCENPGWNMSCSHTICQENSFSMQFYKLKNGRRFGNTRNHDEKKNNTKIKIPSEISVIFERARRATQQFFFFCLMVQKYIHTYIFADFLSHPKSFIQLLFCKVMSFNYQIKSKLRYTSMWHLIAVNFYNLEWLHLIIKMYNIG